MSPLRGSPLGGAGAGVMAEAIIAGVLDRQLVAAGNGVASHPRADRRHALGEKYGIHVTADNAEAARRGDVEVLGIKPQVMPAVLQQLRASLAPEKLVISIIAGATTATLRSGLDHGAWSASCPTRLPRSARASTSGMRPRRRPMRIASRPAPYSVRSATSSRSPTSASSRWPPPSAAPVQRMSSW